MYSRPNIETRIDDEYIITCQYGIIAVDDAPTKEKTIIGKI